jgi:HK97 family phage portal protein
VNLLGFDVTLRKAAMQTVNDSRGGWFRILEPFSGAWQRNIEWTTDSVLAHHAVYTCITLIANDVGKLRPKLVERDATGIWTEIDSPAFSPVLRRPNHYQNRIQFLNWWVTSKLVRGNAYVLKDRDGRGVVTALYLLDPDRVVPLVAPDGSIFYRLNADNLSGLEDAVTVPASEIIHDRMNCLFHPLVGVSPIFAAGLAAHIGITIGKNSASFFDNDSSPPGILTAPGVIKQDVAEELVARWHSRVKGQIAALGNGMEYKPLRMTVEESQTIEHLKWSAETIASTFHVPAFKIGVGQMPTYSNGEILDQRYYSDCLQSHIEQIELCLDEGLGLVEHDYGVELDLDGLLRMDTATQMKTLAEGVKAGILAPDEARHTLDKKPVKGGATPYLQQQNFSLAALDERDRNRPFDKPDPAPEALPPPLALPPGEEDRTVQRAAVVSLFRKAIAA